MIEKVLDNARRYITKESDLQMIESAYLLAKKYHENQFRKSGEPYIIHPIEVAYLLTTVNAGPIAITSGLLHDIIEDTDITYDEIKTQFNEQVANIVDGVTKITAANKEKKITPEENHRKMIEAISDDIRVIIVKLCDRLHNIRTLGALPPAKQKRIAKETLDIYAPFANRLGMHVIKSELEDTAFYYYDRKSYNETKDLIEKGQENRLLGISLMVNKINTLMDNKNIRVKGRAKSVYSVYNKMKKSNLNISQIYDLSAIRLIVDNKIECYKMIGIIHSNFTPVDNKFKDYIAVPKDNMYQSLHTTVFGLEKKIYEIQIRTEEMDNIAEYGVAAHWAYKEGVSLSMKEEQLEIADKLSWYKDMVNYKQISKETHMDYYQSVKQDILSSKIFVYTPKGDRMYLPYKSTPIDVAFHIHSKVGESAVEALVNNKVTELFQPLKNGDVVQIITNESSFGPTQDWLKYCKSRHAQSRIKSLIKKNDDKVLEAQGESELISLLAARGKVLDDINDNAFRDEFFRYHKVNNIAKLCLLIGQGEVDAASAVIRIFDKEQTASIEIVRDNKQLESYSEGTDDFNIRSHFIPQIMRATCCNPIPGEKVVGVQDENFKIMVHIESCGKLKEVNDADKMLEILWTNIDNKRYKVGIAIELHDRDKILSEIVNVIQKLNIQLGNLSIDNKENGHYLCKVHVNVRNLSQLDILVSSLSKIENVVTISRIREQ